jgi:hypothetical protein
MRLLPVDYDDRRARAQLVVMRVDPKALWKGHVMVGGVVKVVERVRERLCLRGTSTKLGYSSSEHTSVAPSGATLAKKNLD